MRTYLLTSLLAVAGAGVVAAAQAPAGHQDQTAATVTITGCVYEERQVPGRTPNVAERAGVLEDYILAEVTGGPVGATMYKIESLEDERLREFIGRRVELSGRVDDDDDDDGRPAATGTSGTADRSPGPDRIELPEFEATSIRAVAGTCPAAPSSSGTVSGSAGAPRTDTPTATDTESQTPTAPVTEAPTHPATNPQPQPQPQAPPPPVTQTPAYPQTSPPPPSTVTLTGCLYRERDVPGRTPNVAERAGILEDYILADARFTRGDTPPTIGKMFKVERIADEKLAQFVGKRVEVTGTLDVEENEMQQAGTAGTTGTTEDRSPGPDRIELPEFEAASIREVAGTCPAVPQP